MLYTIQGCDAPESLALRRKTRPEHLEYVELLRGDGRLILAGPHPAIDSVDPGDAGFSGSLIVAEFESLEAAEVWAKDDPYARAGVFSKVEVKPFIRVLP